MVLGGLVCARSSAAVLGSGRDPSVLATGTTSHLAQRYNVQPLENASRGRAIEADRRAGEMQAQLLVTKSEQRAQQSQAQAYLDYLSGNMDHAQFMMKTEAALQRKQAQFGKAVARYQFGQEKTQASYDGYTSVLNASVATFSGM